MNDLSERRGQGPISRTASPAERSGRPYQYPEQFLLSRRDVPAPKGWNVDSLRGWQLQRDPRLSMQALLGAGGRPVGWLLGTPTLNGTLLRDGFTARSPSDLYRLGGPWAAIHFEWEKLYVDSFGQLSVVYSKNNQIVSTNPELIPGARTNEKLVALVDIPRQDNWYPFGLTPKRNVSRLLPNHNLDLETWTVKRHWPDPSLAKASEVSVEEGAAVVARAIKEHIAAIAEHYPLRLALTAGYDTRVVLACARQFVGQLECVTHRLHPVSGELDATVAAALAQAHRLTLKILGERPSTTAQQAEWLRRTGRSAAGASYNHVGTLRQNHGDIPTLSGHGAEILKGAYYDKSLLKKKSARGKAAGGLTAAGLVERLHLPANEEVFSAAERWLAHVPSERPEAVLDLLYAEQRMGSWAGVLRLGNSGVLELWPFAHREVLETALRLPVRAKVETAVHRRIIEQEWPELLEVPINKWWGWRKWERTLSRENLMQTFAPRNLARRLEAGIHATRRTVALRTRLRRWTNGASQ